MLSVVLQESSADQSAVEHNDQIRLEKLREDLESEHQGRCEDLEKKYAYKLEQLRQDFADKHDQVITQLITTITSVSLCCYYLFLFLLTSTVLLVFI